jgi:BCD family chlorophyll transporter-like MFS transporter
LLVGLIGAIAITRKWCAERQTLTTSIGLVLSALPLAGLAVCAVTGNQALLIPSLVLFGVGFGIYTAGGSPLLMVMSLDERAGVYLGLWSMAQLLARGVGILLGGILRDVVLALTGSLPVAYGSIFALEAVGFMVCIGLLRAADVGGFARAAHPISPVVALSMAD